uniref:Putative secreted protein n=1 Tax=Ixodes ricinus TaxID=34613 RepID=A0A6B0UFI5_IXORI
MSPNVESILFAGALCMTLTLGDSTTGGVPLAEGGTGVAGLPGCVEPSSRGSLAGAFVTRFRMTACNSCSLRAASSSSSLPSGTSRVGVSVASSLSTSISTGS